MTLRLLGLLLALFASAPLAASVPFWGEKTSQPTDTAPADLKPGAWVWAPQSSPTGPVVVVVSLTEQRAYAYRNGVQIGVSTTSSGRKGYETPTGIFTVLQKDKDHHSSIYNNAAMPYTQRLTWGGVALHAGGLPGYPSSHGCVHLPSEFAKLLFDISPMGMTVVVAEEGKTPVDTVHPTAFSPIAFDGHDDVQARLASDQLFRWMPEASPEGPVSVLLSAADRRVLVFRNGIEIGRARIDIRGDAPLGTHVYVVKGDVGANGRANWFAVGVPGHETDADLPLDPEAAQRVVLPPAFLMVIQPLLQPGTTLVVTDAAVLPATTGANLEVMTSEPPEGWQPGTPLPAAIKVQ